MTFKRGGGPNKKVVPPSGAVRQSQAVGAFGPGSMMDLLDQAVLVGGLDFWAFGGKEGRISIPERRLRDALAPRFEAMGRKLSVEDAFRIPPAGNDREATRASGIQVLEFPRWFVCQNPKCHALVRKDGLELKGGRYRHDCERDRSHDCVPIRFLAACKRGHCDDWDWKWFAHSELGQICSAPLLRIDEGATGDFSQIAVSCTSCGAKTKLNAAYAIKSKCRGERPWLGREGREPCDEDLQLLVRTASNSYFAQVESALSVPDLRRAIDDAVAAVWDVLNAATAETLVAFRTIPKVKTALAEFDDDAILAAIARRRSPTRAEPPLREVEYAQFVHSAVERAGELPRAEEQFFARKAKLGKKDVLPPGFGPLVLASKLREVRAQIGFTRIVPVTPELNGQYSLDVITAPLGLQTDWLPASEVRGEGFFVGLDREFVLEWELREAVRARAAELEAGYVAWAGQNKASGAFPGVRFYMLHTLAHLVLTSISLECGYPASSLRERIYCSNANADVFNAGFLISTGTAGTDGTLGGLVEQGRKLRAHLQRAYEYGELCSNDPVCALHSPAGDGAGRFLEGAACHACLFVSECSCEWFNRFLDRSLVIPTLGNDRSLAFLGARP